MIELILPIQYYQSYIINGILTKKSVFREKCMSISHKRFERILRVLIHYLPPPRGGISDQRHGVPQSWRGTVDMAECLHAIGQLLKKENKSSMH